MNAPRSCQGFSLLEVLVAFTILAMLLGALFDVFSGGMRAAHSGERYTRAVVIAQSQLSALSTEQTPALGTDGGVTDDEYRWRTTITEYSDDALSTGTLPIRPLKVSVEVFWEEAGTLGSVTLHSMLLASTAGR